MSMRISEQKGSKDNEKQTYRFCGKMLYQIEKPIDENSMGL